jgi:hypothetical protein
MITGKPHINIDQMLPLVDDEKAVEIYADNFAGLVFNQGNLTLTLATTRCDHTKDPPTNHRSVAVRLVLPVATVADLHISLGQVLKDLANKGFIKTAPTLQVVQ